MIIRKTLMAASVAALMLGTAMSAQACFTVIVGKDALLLVTTRTMTVGFL